KNKLTGKPSAPPPASAPAPPPVGGGTFSNRAANNAFVAPPQPSTSPAPPVQSPPPARPAAPTRRGPLNLDTGAFAPMSDDQVRAASFGANFSGTFFQFGRRSIIPPTS